MADFDFQAIFDAYAKAALDKDVDAMLAIYSPEIQAFDMWGIWSFAGAAFRTMNEDWLGSLSSESVVVEFSDIETRYGADMAVAVATIRYSAVSPEGETLRSMQNRLSWVAQPVDGAWRIVHQHTSVPLDNDMKGMLQKPD